MCGFVVYISFSSPKLMFLVPFFTGSIVAAIAFWNFYAIYMKLQLQAEKAAAAEAEALQEKIDNEGIEFLTEEGRNAKK